MTDQSTAPRLILLLSCSHEIYKWHMNGYIWAYVGGLNREIWLSYTIPIGSMVLLYMVTWIPSIYPLYVSINIPAPWIRHGICFDSLARLSGPRNTSGLSHPLSVDPKKWAPQDGWPPSVQWANPNRVKVCLDRDMTLDRSDIPT
jgi:hypothetical protein